MQKESLSTSMPKLILAIVLIVCVGAVMGLMGYALIKPKISFVSHNEIKKETIEEKTKKETIENKTANWQTHQNEKYGFEVKYPENWEGHKTAFSDLALFYPPENQEVSTTSSQHDETIISVRIITNSSIQEEINSDKISAIIVDKNNSIVESNTSVDSVQSKQIKLLYQKSNSPIKELKINTYFNHKNNLYKVSLTFFPVTNQNTKQEAINIYNSFLSTFKFIEKEID